MDKTAAEKIAHEYYNTGLGVALQQAGLIKEANIAALLKRMGIGAGAGLGALGLAQNATQLPGLLNNSLAREIASNAALVDELPGYLIGNENLKSLMNSLG